MDRPARLLTNFDPRRLSDSTKRESGMPSNRTVVSAAKCDSSASDRTTLAVLRGLVETAGTAGNLTTGAHLAALAIEYDGEVCSADSDFGRFAGLRWTNPLD